MKNLEKVKPYLWIAKLVGVILAVLSFCMLFGDQARIDSYGTTTTYGFSEVIFKNGFNGALGFIGYLCVIASGVLLLSSYILEAKGNREKAVKNINLISLICSVIALFAIAFIPTVFLNTKLDGVTGSALYTAQSLTAMISALIVALINIFIYMVEPPKKENKSEETAIEAETKEVKEEQESEENNSL
ncbi:MAG: hypothetical protein LUC16_01325 [Coprobacillus sp.]|nr:hypothetical protein [Coprobacillus sp.]